MTKWPGLTSSGDWRQTGDWRPTFPVTARDDACFLDAGSGEVGSGTAGASRPFHLEPRLHGLCC